MNPKEGERASPSVARIVSNGRKLHAVLVGIRAIAHGPARLKDAIVRVRCAESLGEKRRSYEPKTTTLITPRVGIEKLKIEVTSFASALRAAHPPVRPPAPTMGMFGGLFGAPTFNPTKCKTALRLCLGRVKLLRNKKTNALVNLKRNIADLLNQGKDDSARVRVEAVLREEATLAAFELLDLFCELLIVRLPLIEQSKDLPEDLREAVATVVYCARRMGGEIPELKDVKTQFSGKYGTQYATACSEDTTAEACGVAALAIEKLSLAAPSADIKIEALKTIAEKHGARFDLDALERATKGNEQKKEVQASDEKLSSISNGTEQYADAGQAAAAARAAAMEAAAAADAASRFVNGNDAKINCSASNTAAVTHSSGEHTVGVITSLTPVQPPGFLVDTLPPPNKGNGEGKGKSVSQVVGGDFVEEDFKENDVKDVDENDAVDASESTSAESPAVAPKPEVPDYARPSPPPGIGGTSVEKAETRLHTERDSEEDAPNETTTNANSDEALGGDEKTVEQDPVASDTKEEDSEQGEDFDAFAARLAALKRGDVE